MLKTPLYVNFLNYNSLFSPVFAGETHSLCSDAPLLLQRCVVVQEIFPEGLIAQDGRLQSGDQIIEVDGVDMTAATHSHVCQELRKFVQPTLRLGVYREKIHAFPTQGSPSNDTGASINSLNSTTGN